MTVMTAKVDQMRKITEDLVDTYCTRVTLVSELITGAYEQMERHKEAREVIRQELKEVLAENTSLRRKDFDAVMHEALEPQLVHEKRVKENLHRFLAAQKILSDRLKKALHDCDLSDVRDVKHEMEHEVEQIRGIVYAFHHKQTSLIDSLKSLIDRGPQLTVKEFKDTLGRIGKGFVSAVEHLDGT